jgi:hypothetical protein
VRVAGSAAPVSVYPVPLTVAALTVTDAVPEEVSVIVCVAGVFSATLPKARLVAFTLSVAADAFSCRA